ncbi:MAG: hypothetical protein AABX05_01455, partial [Nanoarchaeota archaeon]
SPEKQDKCKEVMAQYGDYKWWRSQDPVEVAMYQIFQEYLLVDFSLFHNGIEKLLDRLVFTHELALNHEGLKEEAKQAIGRYLQGMGVTDEYRETAIKNSIQMFAGYSRVTGKQLLAVGTPEPRKN